MGEAATSTSRTKVPALQRGAQSLLLLTAFRLADLVQGDWDREREEITR